MGLGVIIGVFGVLFLFHAAYSTIQYRGILKIMEEEFSGPPMNVVLELLLGFVFCVSAALTVPGNFLSIHPDSDENSKLGLHDIQSQSQSTSFRNRYEAEALRLKELHGASIKEITIVGESVEL